MEYFSVAKTAAKWNISQHSMFSYYTKGCVSGTLPTGNTWNIPTNAEKPDRAKQSQVFGPFQGMSGVWDHPIYHQR